MAKVRQLGDPYGLKARRFAIAEANRNLHNLKEKSAKDLHDIAIEAGGWLFDPTAKRWYTPEEFYELAHTYNTWNELFKKVVVRDPVEALEEGYEKIAELHSRMLTFTKQIVHYYMRDQ